MRWLRIRTIRGRITAWSVVIAVALTCAAGYAFLVAVDAIVASSTKTLLASDGAQYEAAIHAGLTTNFPKPGDDQLIAIVAPGGSVVQSNLPDHLRDRLGTLLTLHRGVHYVAVSNRHRYDVANESIHSKAGTWHIIEARSRAPGDVVLNGLKLVLAFGVLAIVIGFGVTSWLVSGLALRPVGRMRERARSLSQADSSDLLPVGPVTDELSALAATLNDFITSVRSSSDREKQMIADASHELRTPVAVLRTQLQLAHLSTGDASALEKEIGAAEVTLERLSNLTTNLLTLSRIEAGDAAPATSCEVLLAEFYRSMDRAIVLGSARAVSVDFAANGIDSGGLVSIVPADFAGLVDNLVVNAITASPRGSAVEVSLDRRADALVLTVSDSGHGMSESFLAVAFDRFSRESTSRPRSVGGSGLGLAIVKAIAEQGGGTAKLEPRASGGLVATVELPIRTL